jgi:hypothetical protein
MPLRRRTLLASVATGVVATAGCRGALTQGVRSAEEGAVSDSDAPAGDTIDSSLAANGRPSDVCDRPLAPGDIVGIGEPAFGTEWPDDVKPPYRELTPDSTVVGVVADGEARAYPLSVLSVNEVVNDTFGGPLLVTFCPLCRSAVVAERRVAGSPSLFDVTGILWRPPRIWVAASEQAGRARSDRESGVSPSANLVMYDHATESYWSQLIGEAICGPRRGDRLSVRPFSVTTWGAWRDTHPRSEVLLPPPASEPLRSVV